MAFDFKRNENQVSLRHPMHRYCTQHHTTDRIPNADIEAEAVAEYTALRLRAS